MNGRRLGCGQLIGVAICVVLGLIGLGFVGLMIAAPFIVTTAGDYIDDRRFRDPETGVAFLLPDGYALEDQKINRPMGRKAILFERPGMAGPPGCAIEFWTDPPDEMLRRQADHARRQGGSSHVFDHKGHRILGVIQPSLLTGFEEQSLYFASGAQGYTLTCMNAPKDRAAFKADLESMLASLSIP